MAADSGEDGAVFETRAAVVEVVGGEAAGVGVGVEEGFASAVFVLRGVAVALRGLAFALPGSTAAVFLLVLVGAV